MKKKLKDLTDEQIDEICDKHPLCLDCQFYSRDNWYCLALSKDLWGETEIENEN